jgi:putative tricarboxylic transport membrane protein
MELLSNLALGMQAVWTWPVLVALCLGVALGCWIGRSQALGAEAAVALMLPWALGLDALPALGLLLASYLSARLTALVQGERLARPGSTRAVGLGAGVAGLAIALLAVPVTILTFRFGPAEYFAALLLAGIAIVAATPGPRLQALAMAVLGLLLSQVGEGLLPGAPRFAFGRVELARGLDFSLLALGVVGVGAALRRWEGCPSEAVSGGGALANGETAREVGWRGVPELLRGALLGLVAGLMPSGRALLERGAIDPTGERPGVIQFGRRAALSAAGVAALLPLLTLALPLEMSAVPLLAGVMSVKLPVGPQFMTSSPANFWGGVVEVWLAAAVWALVNRSLQRRATGRWLTPTTTAVCWITMAALGAQALHGRELDLILVALFAGVGYALTALRCELAPLMAGFVLGPLLEEQLRRALSLASGDWSILISRPVSAGVLTAAGALLLAMVIPNRRRTVGANAP